MGLKFKALLLGDLLIAWLSFQLALYARFGSQAAHQELVSKPLLRVTLYVLLLITVSYVFDLYSLPRVRNNLYLLKIVIESVAVSFLGLSAIFFLNPDWMIGRGLLAISLSLFICFQFTWHLTFSSLFNLPYLVQNIIVIGSGKAAQRIGAFIKSAGAVDHSLAGFVSHPESETTDQSVPEEMILGNMEQLLEINMRVSAAEIIIADPHYLEDIFSQNLLLNSKLLGVEISDERSYFERVSEKLMLENMGMKDLICSSGFRRSTPVTAIKRVVDVMIAVIGIAFTLPLLPTIVFLVKFNSPGPVFYRQVRVGYMGKRFTLYKFRTMEQDIENDTGAVWAQENDDRIKPIGNFLRKSRLDELPQLFNVLMGEMSFIGPRPERPEFADMLQEVIPFYAKRHFLKPGITGWAQIKCPYGASVEESFEKLRYDLYYLKNMNPVLDTIIFLKTIKVIFSQFGAR